MKVDEIARKRGLTPSTISEHLVQLIGEGRSIDLNRILSKERIALIGEAIARTGSERLAPIKTLLPQDVSYEEIRLVAGNIRAKDKKERQGVSPLSENGQEINQFLSSPQEGLSANLNISSPSRGGLGRGWGRL